MILMLAPAPYMAFGALPSGASYQANQYGLVMIINDSAADQSALVTAGCFTLSPFGGWGNFGFDTLADLYAADLGSILPFITGFPRWTVVTIFSDPVPANCGTWTKTGFGNGSGAWVQVSTQTLFSIAATCANAQAVATAKATAAAASATAAQSSAHGRRRLGRDSDDPGRLCHDLRHRSGGLRGHSDRRGRRPAGATPTRPTPWPPPRRRRCPTGRPCGCCPTAPIVATTPPIRSRAAP